PCLRAPPPSRVGLLPTTLAVDVTGGRRACLWRACAGSGSRRPQCAEVDGGIARLPAAEETLDRWMEDDAVEILDAEEAMSAHGGVVRGDGLERAGAKIAGEDDVHDVLRGEAPHGGNRVDDRDGPFDREILVDADLLRELAVQRVDEALARVDTSAREQPVLAAGLFVAAQEHALSPAEDGRDADPRFRRHHLPEEP